MGTFRAINCILAAIFVVFIASHSSANNISTTDIHNIILDNEGKIYTWGHNYNGQLGDGTTIARHKPVNVDGITSSKSVSAGLHHSLALANDSTVWAWGDNLYGTLGDGTTTERHTPVQVVGLANISAISAGYGYSLALSKDGRAWAWGGKLCWRTRRRDHH